MLGFLPLGEMLFISSSMVNCSICFQVLAFSFSLACPLFCSFLTPSSGLSSRPLCLRLLSFKSQILWEPPTPNLSALWGCCFWWRLHTQDCELEVLGGWCQSEQAAPLRVLLSLRNCPSSPGCSLNSCFTYYNELLYFFFFYWQEGYSQNSHSVRVFWKKIVSYPSRV